MSVRRSILASPLPQHSHVSRWLRALAGVDHVVTGRVRDAESGLYYYRARIYDAALGQFLSEDPIGFDAGDSNLRRYVGNKSTFAVDPSGLEDRNVQQDTLYVPLSMVRCAVCHGDAQGRFVNILGSGSTRPGVHQLEALKLLNGEPSRVMVYDDYPQNMTPLEMIASLDRNVEALGLGPRAQGTLRLVQAGTEYAVAVPLALAPEVSSKFVAVGVAGHATDVANAGVNEIITNKYHRTYTSRLLEAAINQTPAFVSAEPMAEFLDAIGPAPVAGQLRSGLQLSANSVSGLVPESLRAGGTHAIQQLRSVHVTIDRSTLAMNGGLGGLRFTIRRVDDVPLLVSDSGEILAIAHRIDDVPGGAVFDTIPSGQRLALFDGEYAAGQLLGHAPITPAGRQINFHAAERMVNPPRGRAPLTAAEVDHLIDTADHIKKVTPHALGDTVTLQNTTLPGKPQVVVDAATGKRIITVINPRRK